MSKDRSFQGTPLVLGLKELFWQWPDKADPNSSYDPISNAHVTILNKSRAYTVHVLTFHRLIQL